MAFHNNQTLPNEVLFRILELSFSVDSTETDLVKLQSHQSLLCLVCRGWLYEAQKRLHRHPILVGRRQVEKFIECLRSFYETEKFPVTLVIDFVAGHLKEEEAGEGGKKEGGGTGEEVGSGPEEGPWMAKRREHLPTDEEWWDSYIAPIVFRCRRLRVLTLLNLKSEHAEVFFIPRVRSPYLRQVNLRLDPSIPNIPRGMGPFALLLNSGQLNDVSTVVLRRDYFEGTSEDGPPNRPDRSSSLSRKPVKSIFEIKQELPKTESKTMLHDIVGQVEMLDPTACQDLDFEWTGDRGILREGIKPAPVTAQLTEIGVILFERMPISCDEGRIIQLEIDSKPLGNESDHRDYSPARPKVVLMACRQGHRHPTRPIWRTTADSLRDFLMSTKTSKVPQLRDIYIKPPTLEPLALDQDLGPADYVLQESEDKSVLGSKGILWLASRIVAWRTRVAGMP